MAGTHGDVPPTPRVARRGAWARRRDDGAQAASDCGCCLLYLRLPPRPAPAEPAQAGQEYSHKWPQPAGQCELPSSHFMMCCRWPPWLQPWHHTNSPLTTWWQTAHMLAQRWQRSHTQPRLLMGRLQWLQLTCSVVDAWLRQLMARLVLSLTTWLDTFQRQKRCSRSM